MINFLKLGGKFEPYEKAVSHAFKSIDRQWDKADAITQQMPTIEDIARIPLHYGPISDKLHAEYQRQIGQVCSARGICINALVDYILVLQAALGEKLSEHEKPTSNSGSADSGVNSGIIET